MKFRSFNIYFANVKDFNGFMKKRPVLALSSKDDNVVCFKITSQFRSKSKYIRHNYCLLRNYRLEGLRKRSSVDMNSVIKVPKRNLISKFGYLSRHDFKKVVDFGLSRY